MTASRSKGLESGTGTGTGTGISRRTRNGSYSADRRLTDDLEMAGRGGWGWNQQMVKHEHGSDVGLVHELGAIAGTEHIEEGRGRGFG
jgi:hypothetical protein